MRIAILCNGRALGEWQRRAVELIAPDHDLFLLVADQPARKRSPLRHAFYYLLNLAAIRNRLTRDAAFPTAATTIVDRLDFTPDIDGAWASLPDQVVEWLAERRIDAIVKFGLGLLRVPDQGRLAAPILSYHHGDPRAFRGRPAGFYEMTGGESFVGQVVQILGNRIDAGEVLAFAESRVIRHSYKRTLVEAYGLSPWLLPQALRALATGERVAMDPAGRNHRLPSNWRVARFVAARAVQLARHLLYGAFVEKIWRVSTVDSAASTPHEAVDAASAARDRWHTLTVRPPHGFHADPFFLENGEQYLVEAMNRHSGKGEIVRIEGDRQTVIGGLSGHASYPAPIEQDGRLYIVPEITDWASPGIFAIDGDAARKVADLDISEDALIDPTLLHRDGRVYLFANRASEGPAVLRLWSADSLFGRFEPHPDSPIRVSARGARMAGQIEEWHSGLFRIGQDFRAGYGDGMIAFRIVDLTPHRYREELAGSAAFDEVRGPHTVNIRDGRLLFDHYVERVSPLAGVRRLLNRL